MLHVHSSIHTQWQYISMFQTSYIFVIFNAILKQNFISILKLFHKTIAFNESLFINKSKSFPLCDFGNKYPESIINF